MWTQPFFEMSKKMVKCKVILFGTEEIIKNAVPVLK
jgi:hypothetical protein